MIKKQNDFREEKRQIANGNGEIILRHRLEKEDMFGKSRLCAEIVVEPGRSIGEHSHETEIEIFYVLKGSLVSVNEDGSEESFEPGDVMVTGGGGKHSLRNDTDSPAVMLAFIAI